MCGHAETRTRTPRPSGGAAGPRRTTIAAQLWWEDAIISVVREDRTASQHNGDENEELASMPVETAATGWILQTASTGYALEVTDDGHVLHRYWGKRLVGVEDYSRAAADIGPFTDQLVEPEEYPAHGGIKYSDPCLKATFSDGTRDLVLRFVRAEIPEQEPECLDLYLADVCYPLDVVLHYRVHSAYDLIERWVSVRNTGESLVTLERIWSAQWHLPQGDEYRLTHFAGGWSDEGHIVREPLTRGIKRLESRRLTTSHHHAPYFAVDRGTADEESGDVWFGTLAWSGNWAMSAEVTDFAVTRIGIGLNDWDFALCLRPGQAYTTPACFGGYSASGFGHASRHLHDFARENLLPHGWEVHKVLYNSWEATTFSVDETSQAELARLAAAMGVELFVMDDGWFHGRAADNAGLGDWWPDARKFPRGLAPLIADVNALGMDFGLWIEPEMVNPDSDLYRAHPDWVIHFPTRQRSEARNQLILNLARTDVQDYLIASIDALLSENNIAFVKWDMNRNVSEPGWPDAPVEARELWVRYVEGLYHVWGTLHARHPRIIFQSCSGGGGRADFGMLRLADQIWTSDNTEATARLGIQEGFSFLFPASTMEAWVTDVGRGMVPLSFRFAVAMSGVLGVGGHLARWSEEERAEAARWIMLYKEIRPIVQAGDQYRLRSPQRDGFAAVQYMSKDRSEGVLFAYRTWLPDPRRLPVIYPRGLEWTAEYEIEGIAGARSGAGWMHGGIRVKLGNLESTIRRIRRL